jgi:serine/threonine protein phosphatase PrpC
LQAENYEEVFRTQMLLCNDHLNSMPHIRTELSGSTAITAILEDNGLLTVANVGDSRCILGQLGNKQLRVYGLSTDHNPMVPEEAERILSKNVSAIMHL